MTGVSAADFLGTFDAARAALPKTDIAPATPAPANVPRKVLLFIFPSLVHPVTGSNGIHVSHSSCALADLDGSVLVDGDRIIRLDSLEKLVTELIDRDDALPIPDVTHEETGG